MCRQGSKNSKTFKGNIAIPSDLFKGYLQEEIREKDKITKGRGDKIL